MSCKIDANKNSKLHIPRKIINNILKKLNEDHEIAGMFKISNKSVVNYTMVEGSKDSVEAPKAIVNYHTHPIHCYNTEKVIWGWPSGEDIRESIIFGMKGSIAHVVTAVEGTYIMQVNPCVLENLCNLSECIEKEYLQKFMKVLFKNKKIKDHAHDPIDLLRGLLILTIEIYFRSTHVYRTLEYNKIKGLNPEDFIAFSNSFKLGNIDEKNEVNGCKNINCNGVWTFEEFKHKQSDSFKDYVNEYEYDTYLYSCDHKGNTNYTKVLYKDIINKELISMIKNLNLGTHCKYPKELWLDQWLLIGFTKNEIFLNDKWVTYMELPLKDQERFLHEKSKIFLQQGPDENVFYFFDVSDSCTYEDIRKHISVKYEHENKICEKKKDPGNTNYVIFGSPNCGYCTRLKEKLDALKINYSLEYRDSIRDAIDNASHALKNKNIKSIPILTLNGKIIDHNDRKNFVFSN